MKNYSIKPHEMAETIYKTIVDCFDASKLYEKQLVQDIEAIIKNGLKEKVYLQFTQDNLKAAMRGDVLAESTETCWKKGERQRVICIDSHLKLTACKIPYPIVTLDEDGKAHYWRNNGMGTSEDEFIRLYKLE